MATQVERAIAWARRQIGVTKYKGRCQAFVADCYYLGAGMPRRSASTANAACSLWRVSTSRANIPVGAAVYFSSPTSPAAGHVGLYIGNGQVIHAFGKVKCMTLSGIIACGYAWKGWGWNGGAKPSGAGSAAAATGAGGTAAAKAVAASSSAAAQVVHIPQTEKIFTVYESDAAGKGVDEYAVTWQSLRSGVVRDISSRTGGLTLTDDAASLCLELSFSVLPITDGEFVTRVDIEPGDYVAVMNHTSEECVFLGQVQSTGTTAGEGLRVQALDKGRLLTTNEVICQFGNVPAKTAIEQAAAKAGITSVSCPNLVSTVYTVYKDSAADIIRDILATVTAENGVTYFPRMVGDTLVIRSYGATPIQGRCRQAANLRDFDILDEAGAPEVQRSIADLRNSVVVYSEADESVSVKATEEDAASIQLYGRRQALETWSDQDAASAAAKAKTTLANLNRETEEVRLSAYGSDRIVAGCRLRLELERVKGDFWVTAVTHSLGQPHRMTMTLRRAT